MIQWEQILLYLVGLLGVLVLGALLVWGLFYLYSYKCDKDQDLETYDDDELSAATIRDLIRDKRRQRRQQQSSNEKQQTPSRSRRRRQTMVSSLRRQATDTDVIVASALSSIPLKELGGRHNDIIVDVGQQMYVNREELGQEEHQCIVCSRRKEITWSQVSCYARTTIGVLVYKRAGDAAAAAAAAPAADAAPPAGKQAAKEPVLSLVEELKNDSVGLLALPSSTLNEQKSRTVSTVALIPSPDSRLEPAREQSSKSTKSAKSSKSAKFSNKSPPPSLPPPQVATTTTTPSARKSPSQQAASTPTTTERRRPPSLDKKI